MKSRKFIIALALVLVACFLLTGCDIKSKDLFSKRAEQNTTEQAETKTEVKDKIEKEENTVKTEPESETSSEPDSTQPVETSAKPTKAPTKAPTKVPTKAPTKAPTKVPTKAPTKKQPSTTPPTQPSTQPTVAQPSGRITGFEQDMLSRVNSARASVGAPALTLNADLSRLAAIRAEELVKSWSHTRPNGTSCFTILDQLTDQSVYTGFGGENIAWGQATSADVMRDWMNSSGHRDNIQNPNFTYVGFGCYIAPGDSPRWVQLFT